MQEKLKSVYYINDVRNVFRGYLPLHSSVNISDLS